MTTLAGLIVALPRVFWRALIDALRFVASLVGAGVFGTVMGLLGLRCRTLAAASFPGGGVAAFVAPVAGMGGALAVSMVILLEFSDQLCPVLPEHTANIVCDMALLEGMAAIVTVATDWFYWWSPFVAGWAAAGMPPSLPSSPRPSSSLGALRANKGGGDEGGRNDDGDPRAPGADADTQAQTPLPPMKTSSSLKRAILAGAAIGTSQPLRRHPLLFATGFVVVCALSVAPPGFFSPASRLPAASMVDEETRRVIQRALNPLEKTARLNNRRLRGAHMPFLFELLDECMPEIQVLSLAENRHIGDAAAASPHLCYPWLLELNLKDNRVTDAGVSTMAGGGRLPRLHSLDLSYNRLTDDAVRGLERGGADGFARKLRVLSLAGNAGITDDGIVTLAEGAGAMALRRLNLSNCMSITDVAAQALATSRRLRHLSTLLLMHTRISDDGAKALTSEKTRIEYLTSLHTLWLTGCPINDREGVTESWQRNQRPPPAQIHI